MGSRHHALRWVRRWNEYDLADFDDYPVAQLLPTREIELVDPIEQYYQIELERTPGCSSCGRAILTQQRPLKIRIDYESDHYPRADTWRPGDHIFLTENDELIISQYLHELWEAALPDSPPFARVETNDPAMPLFWQVTPQGTARVLAPPTLLQARERCPECGRPRVMALSTSPIDTRYGPGRQTLYEDEARLTIDPAAITAGDFWTADRQHGQILESWAHMQGMPPVYRRTARSFRLVSRRLLRLLYEHVAGGWRAIPVEAPSRSTPFGLN